MFAQLGSIQFEGAFGFSTYQLKESASYAQHARIDGKPRLQKTGDALDELKLDLRFHVSFCVPEDEFAKLREAKANGEVLPLLDGSGNLLGRYVISDLDTDVKQLFKDGRLFDATVSVKLLEYVPGDELEDEDLNAKQAGFALSTNNPPPAPITLQPKGPGAFAIGALTDTKANAIAVDNSLKNAEANPAIRATEEKKAAAALKKVQENLSDFETKLQAVKDKVDNGTQIENNIALARASAEAAAASLANGDLSGAMAANLSLQSGVGNLSGSSAQLAKLTAIRQL